ELGAQAKDRPGREVEAFTRRQGRQIADAPIALRLCGCNRRTPDLAGAFRGSRRLSDSVGQAGAPALTNRSGGLAPAAGLRADRVAPAQPSQGVVAAAVQFTRVAFFLAN